MGETHILNLKYIQIGLFRTNNIEFLKNLYKKILENEHMWFRSINIFIYIY